MDAAVQNAEIEQLFAGIAVVPVLTIADAATAVPLGRALVAGGLRVLEVAIRTPASIEALRAMAAEVEGAVVGAGTVLDAGGVQAAAAAGAKFVVSPGLSQPMIWAAADAGLPCLPGVQTPSEVMRARELGLDRMKFFPAGTAGGVAGLKALGGPFPDLRFCPTGGISEATAPDYLALSNVFAVGGSWVAPADAVAAGDWPRIEKLARKAAGLR